MNRRRRSNNAVSFFAFQDIITSVTGIMIFVTLMLVVELLQRTESAPPQATNDAIKQLKAQIAENEREIQRLQARINDPNDQTPQLAVLDEATLRQRLQERRQQNKVLSRQVDQSLRTKLKADRRKTKIETKDSQTRTSETRTLKELQKKVSEARSKLRGLSDGKLVVYNVAKGNWSERWMVQLSAKGIEVRPIGRKADPTQFSTESEFRAWIGKRDTSSMYVLLLLKPDGIQHFESIRDYLKQRGAALGFDLIGADQSAIDTKSGASVK